MSSLLNLSRVARNPKFAQKVTRIVRTETINDYGESVLTETSSNIFATITMASNNDLNRFTDATIYIKAINVITTTPLNPATANSQPDIIVFMGENFLVLGTFAYEYNGFCRAICALTDYQGQLGA